MTLRDSISKSVNEYLESTTIHGFSYLSIGRGILEKLAWLVIICTCFTFAAFLIQQSLKEAKENPVMTTVESVPIQNVPFPAITMDIGDPDLFGYAENIFNGLSSTKILKAKFQPSLEEMILRMNKSFVYDTSLVRLKESSVAKLVQVMQSLCENDKDKKESIEKQMVNLAKEILFVEESYFWARRMRKVV